MSFLTVFGFLKALLPTRKIAAWIVGILAAVVALIMGVNTSDLKASYCASSEVVTLPQIPAPIATPAAVAPIAAPAK